MSNSQELSRLFSWVSSTNWFAGKNLTGSLTELIHLGWVGSWDTDHITSSTGENFQGGELPPAPMRVVVAKICYLETEAHYYQILLDYRAPISPSASFQDQQTTDLAKRTVEQVFGVDIRPDLPQEQAIFFDEEYSLGAYPVSGANWRRIDFINAIFAGQCPTSWHISQHNRAVVGDYYGVLATHQSNTCWFGRQMVVKFFRKLTFGQSVEVELGNAFSDDCPVPSLIASVSTNLASNDDSAGQLIDLLTVTSPLKNSANGWDLALASAHNASLGITDGFAGHCFDIGVALAKVHRELADVFGIKHLSGESVYNRLAAQLAKVARQCPELSKLVDDLAFKFRDICRLGFTGQRIHGDFHLGQCLLSDGKWFVVDFEGEPGKTLAQRKDYYPVWKDVAGFTRSIDYAAEVTIRTHFTSSQWLATSSKAISDWRDRVKQSFLAGYLSLAWPESLELSPNQQLMLSCQECEKAAYELIYELNNRPDWFQIPADFLQHLARSAKFR